MIVALQVQDRSRHILSFKTQYQRLTGHTISANEVKSKKFVCPPLGDTNVQLALHSNLLMSRLLDGQITRVPPRWDLNLMGDCCVLV